MFGKVVSCFLALALVTLVRGGKREELLASGYEYIEGVGYYAFGTDRNWTYAQDDCMSLKARLAVINSEEERKAIVAFLSNNTLDTYAFGGYTNQYDSRYVTTEGVLLKETEYTKWETGSPSGAPNRCVGINTKTGELADLACNNAISYICEHQLWTDYSDVKGTGYYKLHTEGKSWADAYATCESEGAHLLVIDSQDEADAVMEVYNEHPTFPNALNNNHVYIGFRAVIENLLGRQYNGTYLTIYGGSVSDLGYVKWYGDEPIANHITYCGTLFRGNASYFMTVCYAQYAFFCERELQEFDRP